MRVAPLLAIASLLPGSTALLSARRPHCISSVCRSSRATPTTTTTTATATATGEGNEGYPPPPAATTTTTTTDTPTSAIERRSFVARAGGIVATAAAVPSMAVAEQGTATLPTDGAGAGERSLSASWSATDGFDDKGLASDGFIEFKDEAYVAMKDDNRRTPKFQVAIKQRLAGTTGQVVLDVGTGPFALLAIMAARAGAAKVYAVESNPEAAKRARQVVAKARDVAGIIEVIEGYTTQVSLPQKVDLVLAEIVGSVASEEGLCPTILDAQRRFAKRPNDPRSFIPNRVQTFCAPASYALHYALGPPEFDWSKLGAEPVRLNCRDQQLQVLAEPLLVEDINLYGDGTEASGGTAPNGATGFGTGVGKRLPPGGGPLVFKPFTKDRFAQNAKAFRKELTRGGAPDNEATTELASAMSQSVTGLALWPRLVLDDDGTGNAIGDVGGADGVMVGKDLKGAGSVSQRLIVESRGPDGEHQKSHWQTVLLIMNPRPWAVEAGDSVRLDRAEVTLAGPVNTPAKYAFSGAVASPGEVLRTRTAPTVTQASEAVAPPPPPPATEAAQTVPTAAVATPAPGEVPDAAAGLAVAVSLM